MNNKSILLTISLVSLVAGGFLFEKFGDWLFIVIFTFLLGCKFVGVDVKKSCIPHYYKFIDALLSLTFLTVTGLFLFSNENPFNNFGTVMFSILPSMFLLSFVYMILFVNDLKEYKTNHGTVSILLLSSIAAFLFENWLSAFVIIAAISTLLPLIINEVNGFKIKTLEQIGFYS